MAKGTTKAKTRRTAKAPAEVHGAPKVTKRTPAPKQATHKKRKPNTAVFGPEAPPANLRFPQEDDVTAAEMIVFLPNVIRSHDFLYRFMENGLDTPTLTMIVNFHRRPNKGEPIPINSFCKIIEKTMRDAGHEKWTVGKHKAGEFKIGYQPWDGNSLSCSGFRLNCEQFPGKKPNEGGVLENMPFAGLSRDVEHYPSEKTGDALDLSRCVKYAAANSHLALQFPRDFGFLKRLTGGPSRVTAAHRDSCVFDRWRINSRKAEHTVDADVTGFELVEYAFSENQEVIVSNYLARVENGEDPSSAEASEIGGFSPASNQASEFTGFSSFQAEASDNTGYSSILTHTSEGGHSESILSQKTSEDGDKSNFVQSLEDLLENIPLQGYEDVRNQFSLAVPRSLLDGHRITLSAEQPAQSPMQLYGDFSMPYLPSSATWNDTHTEQSMTGTVAPFVQSNMSTMQYGQAYNSPNQAQGYSSQGQDNSGQVQDCQQNTGTGHRFGYNDSAQLELLDLLSPSGYTGDIDWNASFDDL